MSSRLLGVGRWALLAAAVTLIAVGIARDETMIVLEKAANICFECIGIR